jgi:hypothetical protein
LSSTQDATASRPQAGTALRRAAVVISVFATMFVEACGTADSNLVVAHVGTVAITNGAIVARLKALHDTTRDPMSRRSALEWLITSQWLLGEARARRISITEVEVRRRVRQLVGAEVGESYGQLRAFLRSTGEMIEDLESQARQELAALKLHDLMMRGVPAVTEQQVTRFYLRHKHMFVLPGRREAKFTNRKSLAAIEIVKRGAEAGRPLGSARQIQFHETLYSAQVPPKTRLEQAIDASPVHGLSSPIRIGQTFWLFEVVTVVPAHQQSLSAVAAVIRRKLTDERRREVLAEFAHSWNVEWTARTDCVRGHVVPMCRQYAGTPIAVDPFRRVS